MAALIVPATGLATATAAPQRIKLTPELEAALSESVDLSTLAELRSQRTQQASKISQVLLDAERTSLSTTDQLQGRVPLPADLLEGDRILVEIWHSDANRSFHSAGLPALNASIRHQGGNGAPTEAWVPASRMSELAALPGVNRVTPARLVQHLAGSQNTQGANAGNVPPWHAASLDGNGVTIAIIDSFNNTSGQVAALQASGDWPPSARLTTVKIGTGTFGNNAVDHGNAVLEIAYDVAPGATYIAYDTRTLGDWRAAIDQAVAAGANIISASLGAPLDGIGDGTALPGSVAESVEAAAAAGVLYFNAAGNEREGHWGGLYLGNGTSPGGGYVDSLNWGAGGNLNLIPYCLPAGYPVQVTLHWDDWTNVNHDYDMFLYRRNAAGTSWAQVASSVFDQNGGAGQTPQEFVQFTASGSSGGFGCPAGTSVYAVMVPRFNAPTNRNLQLFADGLQINVPSRSLGFPGDSPAAITVAAVDVSSSVQESYSSEGPILALGGGLPTGSESPKPDLASFANVDTVSYGAGEFNGTSAATPHVAGMAALLKQRHPAFTRNQLAQLMRDISAQGDNDLGSAGFDFQHGHGRLRFQQESALVVTQQPLDTDVNDVIPEVLVEVRDTQNLRVLSGPTAAIAVAIEDDPSSGTAVLSGTSPASVTAGIASYTGLSIDVAGNDYTLMFTAAGLSTAESATFDILATAVDGACGTSHGGTFTAAPATNLCAAGTASAVTGSGPWAWTCNGIAGGTNASCSANIQTYTLTYSAGAGGSISGTSPQTVPHGANGTAVTAVPDSGYSFTQWSDASTANPRTDSNVTASISVQAQFTQDPVNGACGTAHGGTFTTAPATNLCAAGTASAVTGSGPWAWTCNGIAGGTNASCSANIQTYTLTYSAGAGGSISGTSPQTVSHGANGTAVSAVPDSGYSFTQWSDASTANPRTDSNVTANISVQAQFTQDPVNGACGTAHGGTFTTAPATNLCAAGTASAVTGSGPWAWTCNGIAGGTNASCSANIQTYSLTYSAGAGGSISGTSPQNVPHGGNGTPVEAVPASGHLFVQWSDSSVDNPRTDINVTANISVTAEFELAPPSDFTPGNIVVYRVGDGTGSLAGNATRIFLDEIDATTGNLVQSIPLPVDEDGANKRCTASGTATAEGMFSRSADRGHLVGGCYDQALTGVTSAGTRVVFRVGPDTSVSTATALTDITSGAARTVASTNGDALWVAGNNFTRHANHGASSSTQLNTLNARVAQIFDGQLYVAVAANINAIGNDLPTSGSPTSTPLTWSPSAPNNIYGFFFADLSEEAEGLDTLYIARDDAGAIAKYSKVDGTWTFNNTVGVDNDYRGLTGVVNDGVVTLFTTRTGGTPAGLFKLVDSAGYNANNNGTIDLVHAAATNTAYRGVAFTPETVITHEVTSSVGSGLGDIDPLGTQLVVDGATTQFTVTPAEGWHVVSVTGCGGTWSGSNPYTTTPISADCDVIATFAQTPIDGVCGTSHGGTFTTAPATNLCAAGTASAVTGSGPWAWTCNGIAGGTNASCSANIQTYTLTYSAGAGGSISGTSPQTVPHGASGTAVTAVPDSGYSFTQWSDASTANPRTDSNVTASISVQAQFTQDPVNGACGTAHGGTFTTAPATNLCAAGTASAVTGSGPWAWTCNGIAGGTNASCSANIQTYTLTYSAGAGGSISGTSPQTVPHGASGTAVTAVPDSGYSFTQWSDASTANPRTDSNVTANISVQAQFTINTYAISVSVDPIAGGSASCSPNPVAHGSAVVCNVNPASGWSVDTVSGSTCTPVDNGDGTWTASNITESCAITVTFRNSLFDATIHKTVTHSLVLLDESGDLVRYEIIVSNNGLDPISDAEVLDLLPEEFAPASWTCEGISGGICTNPGGTGDIAEFVDLPVGASVRFIVEGLVAPVPENGVLNTAEVIVGDDADTSDNTDRVWYQRCNAMNLQTDPKDETLLPHLCIFQDGYEGP